MGDAGLHRRIEIVDADTEHLIHLRQIDGEAALEGKHLTLERGARAKGHNRHPAGGGGTDDGTDFFGGPRERHQVWQGRRVVRLAVAVMVADRRRGGHAIPKEIPEGAQELVGHG